MQGIKNIIFDLGGVIINLDNKRTEDAFTSLGVKDIRSYFGHGHAASFFKEYEVGRIS
ncbi:MAG: HAD family phosphatase, partial [Bacteroidetes bacterium]|nr:HAD family phosphatase [Bacteroidota bacterium]